METKEILELLKRWSDFLLPLLVFGGLFLFRYVTQFTRAKHLKELAPFINGEAVVRPFTVPRIRGGYMGVPYEMLFHAADRHSPGRLELRMRFPWTFGMDVQPRGGVPGLDQLFSRGRGVQTGDEAFDEAVLTRVDNGKEKAGVFLDNPMNRKGLMSLFQEGFLSARFSPKGLFLVKPGDFLNTDYTAEQAQHDLSIAANLLQRV